MEDYKFELSGSHLIMTIILIHIQYLSKLKRMKLHHIIKYEVFPLKTNPFSSLLKEKNNLDEQKLKYIERQIL